MKIPLNILVFVFFILYANSALAIEPVEFKLSVPPLVHQEISLASIQSWDNNIIVRSRHFDHTTRTHSYQFHVVDEVEQVIVPLILDNRTSIIDLVQNKREVFALLKCGEKLCLLSKGRDKIESWRIEDLEEIRNLKQHYRIAVSEHRIFVLTRESIYRKESHGSWVERPILGLRKEDSKRMPSHILVTEKSIFLGYFRGEFGGGLYKINFLKKATVPNYKAIFIKDFLVRGLAVDHSQRLWIATGMNHLHGRWAGLFVYEQEKFYSFINQFGSTFSTALELLDPHPKMHLPGITDITGLCLGPEGAPIILASKIGILKIGVRKPEYIIKEILHFSIRLSATKLVAIQVI